MPHSPLPSRPPFTLRARVLTPLGDGGTRFEPDGVVEVGADGRIAFVGGWKDRRPAGASGAGERGSAGRAVESDGRTPAGPIDSAPPPIDLRPWLLLPGMVDLHAHLPQLPRAGIGAGLHLLAWLDRCIFPLERAFDGAAAERLAPAAFRAMAAAGTTTAVLYGAIWESSVDAAFRAAEAHGLRAAIGKVIGDRVTNGRLEDGPILETSLRESTDLCARWHLRDGGRLRYAFTPRFAISCTPEMLRESASLARATGAYWQTHLSEDRGEVEEVARLFPEATDYLDVYDRAGGLGPRAVLAHAIHLSDREVARLAESGARVAHCPESNLFLASGMMPLARYLEAGIAVGLGSDVAGGPQLSLFSVMRAGAYTQNALRAAGDERPGLGPLDWLRCGSLDGARALGIDDVTGSLEAGKEADLIAVDPALTAPLPGEETGVPADLMSRLIFRAHPEAVRGAWVRGRLLEARRATSPGAAQAHEPARTAGRPAA